MKHTMLPTAVSVIAILSPAPAAKADIVVETEWIRRVHTYTNAVGSGVSIKLQGDKISVMSLDIYGRGGIQHPFFYSLNMGQTWSGPHNGPPDRTLTDSFFETNGLTFFVTRLGHLYWFDYNAAAWRTNVYSTPDHVKENILAAVDENTTNVYIFYQATNRPPATPDTNIRYAVFTRSGGAWDAPAANTAVGPWPGPAAWSTWRGGRAFKDPVTGRFRSVRALVRTADWGADSDGPWICALTNGGSVVLDMNTSTMLYDGYNLSVAVDSDGVCYMSHAGKQAWPALQTNLIFTAFTFDETGGVSILEDRVIATCTQNDPGGGYGNVIIGGTRIALGVNGEIIVAYREARPETDKPKLKIIARDRWRTWRGPFTVAEGDADKGAPKPGPGGDFGMAVVYSGKENHVYLYYGEYRLSSDPSGLTPRTWNGVVHKLKVYDPPPPKGTRVTFR